MHDIDTTALEFADEAEAGEWEQEAEAESEYYEEMDGVFSEAEEMEMAAELLGVSSEEELDQFLGDLIKKAGRVVGRFVKSPTGRALGGLLKKAAKTALPIVGGAVGGYLGGPAGAQAGSSLASAAGRAFGLELEGLSAEDQEFEAARGFVRFAGAAAGNAAAAPASVAPATAAKTAVTAAARQFAPGLLSSAGAGRGAPTGRQSGRWIRKGRKIVLLGV
jgi:uncharacterized protein (DUF697 family)